MQISLRIKKQSGETYQGRNDYEEDLRQLQVTGEDLVWLSTQNFTFSEGDYIEITTDQPNAYLWLKLDETIDNSLVFVPDCLVCYPIHLSENARVSRAETRFLSNRHYWSVRKATPEEIGLYRNLALNPLDQKECNGTYPHAYANVETRNDATFFACNAIDGTFANESHGEYPYGSWGINRQKDAELTIDFGRNVRLDQLAFTLRADFPHDNYWEKIKVWFSDGTQEILSTKKSALKQTFDIAPRGVSWLKIGDLQQSPDESPFPALTQLECFGREEKEGLN